MSFQPSREDGGCLCCSELLGKVNVSVGGQRVCVRVCVYWMKLQETNTQNIERSLLRTLYFN